MQPDAVDHRLARNPVAIVGLAGMFPQAHDLSEFWDNIMAGRDCLTDVPETHWGLEDYYDPDPFAADRTYSRRGGFLPPVTFDPFEFGMPPSTVDSTGLIQLLSLVVANQVLRDAGCDQASWYDPARTGVILGVCGANSLLMPLAARLQTPVLKEVVRSCGLSEQDADRIADKYLAAFPPWTEDSFPGILGNVVAGRVANRLNLGALNCTVDAACASSLAALRMAVSELTEHRADLMITGGCDADNTIIAFMCFSKTPALSLTNQIRPFDQDADGTLSGEGIGMLALKRLADAERDGDRVYAVIRGMGTSSDGRPKSIYAPCGDGQLAALNRAYQDADCPPGTVELVEAHGTGTPVGDEVELAALNEVMADPHDPRHVAVGSVKSQIGHAKGAAGAAGLIKAALALHQKVLPPTLHVQEPSTEANRPDGAIYLNTAARPWVLDPRRPLRRAGVSSFGFGGVNTHVVLEEHPSGDGRPGPSHRVPRARLWHAPDEPALRELLEGDEPPIPPDADIPAGHARLGFLATDEDADRLRATALAQLRANPGHQDWEHADGIFYRRAALPAGTGVAALFAGQGSQYVEMGREALLALPPVRAAFDAANTLFPDGGTLARVVFPPPGRRNPKREAERLRRTEYAQPAIGALALGQYRYLAELGFRPDGLLGHSFGELTALWAAGCFGDDDFRTLAQARGRAMAPPTEAGTDPGAMASARTGEQQLRELLADLPDLVVCNRNAPDEFVVGGPTDQVERFVAGCVQHGVGAQRLPVSAAFHTDHVRHAVAPLAAAVAGIPFAAPMIPVYPNTAGAEYGDDPDANRRILVDQLTNPVDFAGRLEQLYADGCRVFVEFGPRQVLTHLVARSLGERGGVTVIPTDGGVGHDSAALLKRAALRLAVLGLPIRGIDRYDAPMPPAAPAPSTVARVLDGPNFATRARRARYQEQLRDGYRIAVAPAGPAPAGANGARPPGAAEDALSRAAADHLELHTRYLDSQLRTTEQLTDLLRKGTADGAGAGITAGVRAIRDHSLALGEAHTRANEVLGGLLHQYLDGAPPAALTAPAVDAGPAGVDTVTGGNTGTGGNGAGPRTAGGGDGSPATGGDGAGPAGATSAGPNGAGLSGAGSNGAGSGDTRPTGTVGGDRANGQSAAPAGGPAGPSQGSAVAELMAADDQPMDPEKRRQLIANLDRDQVEQTLREIVADKTGYSIDMISPDMDIQTDLGIDSLKQVEIAAEAWRRYPVIERSQMYRLSEARTVGELATRLEQIVTGPASGDVQAAGPVPLGRKHVGLRELPAADLLVDAYRAEPRALLVDDGGPLVDVLAGALAGQGWRTCRLVLPAVAADGDDRWSVADWTEKAITDARAGMLADLPDLDLCVLPVSPGTVPGLTGRPSAGWRTRCWSPNTSARRCGPRRRPVPGPGS